MLKNLSRVFQVFQNTTERTLPDIDKKASNEVKVGVKYKVVLEGRAATPDKNLGETQEA